MIKLIPKTRSQERREPARGAADRQPAQAANGLVRSALEPAGSGAYVEAVREWIERVTVTPRSVQRSSLLRLVR
ncbi:MAG: hypothetical protein JWN04_734 [Myxococcaceae bacterium]|nr:hypothetical protein [Myxococcaceae bacterium]